VITETEVAMPHNTFTNADFYLTAFLITTGCPLKGHSKSDQHQTIFEFEDNSELRDLVAKFYSMTSSVEPMAYSANIRSLKSVIHAANSNSKEHVNNGKRFNNK
jgi:hypothetical protein